MEHNEPNIEEESEKKSFEWRAFFFITIFLFPILSVIILVGFGFSVWMSQVFIFGPPGHG